MIHQRHDVVLAFPQGGEVQGDKITTRTPKITCSQNKPAATGFSQKDAGGAMVGTNHQPSPRRRLGRKKHAFSGETARKRRTDVTTTT